MSGLRVDLNRRTILPPSVALIRMRGKDNPVRIELSMEEAWEVARALDRAASIAASAPQVESYTVTPLVGARAKEEAA